MRPLLFIFGLAFVSTVLIANVHALRCYIGEGEPAHDTEVCSDWDKKCFKAEVTTHQGEKKIKRGCLTGSQCEEPSGTRCTKRCRTDLCNGAVTSIPPVPLLIAVTASAVAALGI